MVMVRVKVRVQDSVDNKYCEHHKLLRYHFVMSAYRVFNGVEIIHLMLD